jgi:hypothetical protein
MLQLYQYEHPHSNLILLKLSKEASSRSLLKHGTIHFGRAVKERRLWTQLVTGDLILSIVVEPFRALVACRVNWKTITLEKPLDEVDQPFVIYTEVIGYTRAFRLRSPFLSHDDFVANPDRDLFMDLWQQCVIRTDIPTAQHQQMPIAVTNKYEIYIASSKADNAFIAAAATNHPFGLRNAFLKLICFQDGRRVGALLAELGIDELRTHHAQWQIFRNELYHIQQQAISIARIYSGPGTTFRRSVHKALIEVLINLAPALVNGTLSIIDGVSYDYHPVALSLGFHAYVPDRLEDSFYYWKPINIKVQFEKDQLNRDSILAKVRRLIQKRKTISYWLAPGHSSDINLAKTKKAWAIRRNKRNTGRWRALYPGNTIFLMTRAGILEVCGDVKKTEMCTVPQFEAFPLWIAFDAQSVKAIRIDISDHLNEQWFIDAGRAGLTPLPQEFGATLKAIAEQQTREGTMWVVPNPYLLHRNEFEIVPGQIFIVQAWELRTKILPVITKILKQHGYSVKSSDDRDGQVIFEDIWTLLNESAAILVDFTKKRPNVYLEYGMALVLGKPIIAITQSKDDIPSDTPNLKYIIYEDSLNDKALEERLPRALNDVISDIYILKNVGPFKI